MPSESKKSKEDTWRTEELDRALKGKKDDMHRRRRKDEDGDRRHHGEEVNGSSRRREGERRSHKSEDEKKSRRHKDRGDSPGAVLTEEDRERLREERRAKRDGGKEEKKSRPKESKPPSKVIIDDDDDDDRRRRRRDDDHRSERRRHGEDESRRHRDDGDRERRHKEKEREKDRERRQEEKERDRDREKRHRDREEKKSRGGEDERRKSDRKEGSSRRHDDERSDRRRKHEEESSSRRRHKDEDDDDEERERRRQERREKREKEKQKERELEREKERERDRDKDRESRHKSERRDDERRPREDKDIQEREERKNRDNTREELRSRAGHRQKESSKTAVQSSNGKSDEEEDDEYNYEEDFEDYEDDFEDDEDPDMKEEGEMEEVLRALDEENNRLVSTSRRSNWSDSTELSDERFNTAEGEPVPSGPSKQKTFINFVSAKQRVMDSSVAGKARKRFEDLSKLIELDVAKYDMFDLPPVKEYELYIRSFGRSDTTQAYVQTHDDDIEREIQTEEIESLSKWTQHPPEDDVAVGGEGINVQASDSGGMGEKAFDLERLSQFLEKVGQVFVTILDEESKTSQQEERQRDGQRIASFSDRASQLGMPNFLQGRQVLGLSFCPAESNSLLSVHSTPYPESEGATDLYVPRASSPVEREKIAAISKLSMVCVWNLYQPMYPTRICVSEMSVTCACFSPLKASLVFGGMHDGSVVLWDLREPSSQHRSMELDGENHLVRFPTYNTAGVLEAENHHSPVVKITSVSSTVVGSLREEGATESSSGLSFQLASVEEKAVVNLWVVAEVAKPDPAGSENDLGLFPGGQIKLLRSSAVILNNPNKYLSTSTELKAIDLQLNPADLNHFYVGTDAGSVVHGVRFGKRAYPQSHSSLIDTPVPVVSVDFSPFGQPYFLAGCEDGTLYLYNTKSENPIATWRDFVSGEKIISVRWSRSRPAVFYVLDNSSTVFTFDLVENGLAASKVDRITVADAISLEVGGDPNLISPGVNKTAYMVMALDSGAIEVLTVSDEMREKQPHEEEFLSTYIDRF